jgi:hypothetical protein
VVAERYQARTAIFGERIAAQHAGRRSFGDGDQKRCNPDEALAARTITVRLASLHLAFTHGTYKDFD